MKGKTIPSKKLYSILVSLPAILILLLGSCQNKPADTSNYILLASTPITQTLANTAATANTVDCRPDIHASSVDDIVGVWSGLAGLPGKGNLELNQDGTYVIKLVEPNAEADVAAGSVIDHGNYRFEGSQLKFENGSCRDAQGNLFACVGTYAACVTHPGTQPAQLKLLPIQDEYSGRKIGLTPKASLSYFRPRRR